MEAVLIIGLMVFAVFLIMVALSRWIFRVNHIVSRLDSILQEIKKSNGDLSQQEVPGVHTDKALSYMQ